VRIVVDFDGVVIERTPDPGDPAEDMQLLEDARAGLQALKLAGHVLILSSCRSNTAQRVDWRLNPLWREHVEPFDERRWEATRQLWQAAHERMIAFVGRELPGVFDAIDDGRQGKILADLYIDDKAFRLSWGGWKLLVEHYGG